MLKRLKTHHLYRHAAAAPLPTPFPSNTRPCGKAQKKKGEEAVEHGLLGVEIIDGGKLRFSSEVSLTPGPTWKV